MTLDLALVHHPVVNRIGETIASTVDEFDVFDACRLSLVYPVRHLWIVTPVASQRALAERLLAHGRNPAREAEGRPRFDAVSVADSVTECLDAASVAIGRRPTTLASSARPPDDGPGLALADARGRLEGGEPMMLLVGKAWGLAPAVLEGADAWLRPLRGGMGFDHFPVRGAIAVLLDRLLAPR